MVYSLSADGDQCFFVPSAFLDPFVFSFGNPDCLCCLTKLKRTAPGLVSSISRLWICRLIFVYMRFVVGWCLTAPVDKTRMRLEDIHIGADLG